MFEALAQNVPISAVFLAVSFVVFFVLCMKGIHPIVVSLLCSLFIGCMVSGGPFAAITGPFMETFVVYMQSYFLPFAFVGIYAQLMNESGMGESIARYVSGKANERNFIIILMVLALLLQLSGITVAPLVIAPLSFSMLKKYDLPRYIALIAVVGIDAVVMFMLPGVPNFTNLLPTSYLGTNLFAAPVVGIVTGVYTVVAVYVFTLIQIKRARKNGITYDPPAEDGQNAELYEFTSAELPGFFVSLLPTIVILAVCTVLQLAFKVDSTQTTIISLLIGIVLVLLLGSKGFKRSKVTSITEGAMSVMDALICVCAICGYGALIKVTASFAALEQMILKLDMDPYLLCVVVIILLSIITASGTSSMVLFYTTFGERALAMGANPEALHRLSGIASTSFDSMPQNGPTIVTLRAFKMSHKEGYKWIFYVQCLLPLTSILVALVMCYICYPIG